MAARRLHHWMVEYYSAASEPQSEPHACIVLAGCEHHGFVRRHAIQIAERITLPIEWSAPVDYRMNQNLVRRAMRQSRHHWRGRVP